ncbi:MAG: class I SAM-dependent methyltransferase [Bacteroidia bacterium]|nr:class I SAM-dependent methyltransferase [Bacteroidia bacterium]
MKHAFFPLGLGEYLRRAQGAQWLHSPFLYDCFQTVVRHQPSEAGARIEAQRRTLARSSEQIRMQDYGAGGSGGLRTVRIADLARRSARHRRDGELLLRLCRRYQPRQGLELGVSLGFSARYQLSGWPEMAFTGLEGDPGLAERAQQALHAEGFGGQVLPGEFTASLDRLIAAGYRPDYVLLDGNHRGAPTLEYVSRLLPLMPAGGILVLDDIRWSEDMWAAWQAVARLPEVTLSIDLLSMGLCFIRRPQAKQHVWLRRW